MREAAIPYFQPIFAADTGKIYAYEVLGRYMENGEAKSLGPFFSSAPDEEALAVDRIVRDRALKQFASEGTDEFLFINLRLKWIAQHVNSKEDLPTIKFAKESGIDLSRLVIEITEEEFCSDNEDFTKVIAYYKSMGCRIAIDNYGNKANDIDRLALISPNILKIDISYIQKSETSYHYREYIKTLTSFAELIGIEVLYEGIETPEQLDICIASKGRFYQGFILAKPQGSIKNAIANYEIFSASLGKADSHVESFFNDLFSEKLLSLVKRVYLCNGNGDQLPYNIEANSGQRIFFQEAIAELGKDRKSYLTGAYRDFSTKEEIHTYVYQIHPDIYLFIDIMLGGKTK